MSSSSSSSSSSWKDFLKTIAYFNGDLYSLTAPPFILSPVSLVEYSQFWCEHPNLLVAPNFITEENSRNTVLDRQIAVTKWFLATLRSQYASRNESLGTEKKPLNPFLGEVFVGKWVDKNETDKKNKVGDTALVSEQVSHHPPVTAYSIMNAQNNTYLSGYNEIKTQIYTTSLTLNVKQYGHAILEYRNLKEDYLITLPGLHIEGLLMASPYVELNGKSYIQASNGMITVIEYSGKGWVSGKKNSFKAKIFKNKKSIKDGSSPLCIISGQWSGSSTLTYDSSKNAKPFYNAHESVPEHLLVKPIEEQHELESRKAWREVADAIRQGSFELINETKSKLETAQREQRKQETESGDSWKTRWFVKADDTDEKNSKFTLLCKLGGFSTKNLASGSFTDKESSSGNNGAVHWIFNPEALLNEKDIVI